jgi:predicted MFS family arabinose efflux permease
MYQLAAFRGLQGLGAGGLMSLAITIIADIVPPRERARYQAYMFAVFGTSSVLGPLAGGFLAGQSSILGITGWRWVFLVNLPVGMLALALAAKVLNLPHVARPARIDWPGAVALAVGIVPLLVLAEQGQRWGWTSAPSVGCLLLGIAGTAAFVVVERRYGDDALLPMRLFGDRVFRGGSAALTIVGMGMFGGMAALPLYLQIVKGMTPTQAGLLTLPLMAGMMTMSQITGRVIRRTGRLRGWPVFGTSMMIIGLLGLSRIGVATPMWVAGVGMVVFGIGLGSSMQPLTQSMQNALPPRDLGVVTATATFARQLGGTIGTAVFLSILFSTVQGKITSAVRHAGPGLAAALADPAVQANPADQTVAHALDGGPGLAALALDDTSFLTHADPRLTAPFLTGFAGSISLLFLVGAAVLVVGLVLALRLPEVPLRTKSGIAARLADEAAQATGTPATPAIPQAVADLADLP